MTATVTMTPSATVTQTKLPPTWLVTIRRVRYELLAFTRETPSLVFNFGYPCLMYLIFVGSGIMDVGGEMPGFGFSQYFLPGMIATGIVVGTIQELGTRVVEERESSMLKRLRTTPTTAAAYVGGKLGQVTIMVLLQNVLLLAVATIGFDASLPGSPRQWAIYGATLFLGICCGSALGFALSIALPTTRSASGSVIPVVLILQFFSGVFFPFNQLPSWMQTVANFFPLRWMASGMRAALYPAEMALIEPSGSFEVVKGLLILGAWTIISVAVALRWFRWLPHEQH